MGYFFHFSSLYPALPQRARANKLRAAIDMGRKQTPAHFYLTVMGIFFQVFIVYVLGMYSFVRDESESNFFSRIMRDYLA